MRDLATTGAERSTLTFHADFFGCIAKRTAHAALLEAVFDIASSSAGEEQTGPAWQPLAYFDRAGRCVATLQMCDLKLATSDGQKKAGGIRLVGVADDWRGHGLFRALMERSLSRGADRGIDLQLLFTEEPELYRRFGFAAVSQHAFTGVAPKPIARSPSRPVDLAGDDFGLVEHLLASRAPVSGQVALVDAPALFLNKVRTADALNLAYVPDDEALVVYEDDGDTLILVDVVAAVIPALAHVLGALPEAISNVTTLFPPDRLDWPSARAIPEENGLMVRGPLPAAMARPFMLPPTAEF